MLRLSPLFPRDDLILNNLEIAQAFATLPDRQQAILGLRLLGYTQLAIAAILGIGRTTIWEEATAAAAALRGLLDPPTDCRG